MKGKNNTDWNKHFRDWETDPQREGDWDSPSPDLWDKVVEDLLPPTPSPRSRWWLGFLGVTLGATVFVALSQQVGTVGSIPLDQLSAFPVPMAAIAESASDQHPGATAPAKKTPGGSGSSVEVRSSTALVAASTQREHRNQRDQNSQSAEKLPLGVEKEENIVPAEARVVPGRQNNSLRQVENIRTDEQRDAVSQEGFSLKEQEVPLISLPLSGQTWPNAASSERNLVNKKEVSVSRLTTLLPTLEFAPIPGPQSSIAWPTVDLVTQSPAPPKQISNWMTAAYLVLPLDQGLQHRLRNWQINELQRTGFGLSLQRTNHKGWFGQLGIQYETADYAASTRYLRIINPAAERQEDDQLVSDYEIDASLLKSSTTPTTVTVERSRNQSLPQNLRVIFEVETAVAEQNLRIPLYLGRHLTLSPKWGVQLQAGAVINQTQWERRTNSVTALAPNLRVREVRFPERVVRQESSSAQLAIGAGLQWQPHPHWQLGVQWQRIGTNEAAPQVLQQVEQQLLLGVSYRW